MVTLNHTIVLSRDKEAAARFFARIEADGFSYGTDPGSAQDGQTNARRGGRAVYFRDLDGHLLELLTRP